MRIVCKRCYIRVLPLLNQSLFHVQREKRFDVFYRLPSGDVVNYLFDVIEGLKAIGLGGFNQGKVQRTGPGCPYQIRGTD